MSALCSFLFHVQEVESNREKCIDHQNITASCGSKCGVGGINRVSAHFISAGFHWVWGRGSWGLQNVHSSSLSLWMESVGVNWESRNLNRQSSEIWALTRARICHQNLFSILLPVLRMMSLAFVNVGISFLGRKCFMYVSTFCGAANRVGHAGGSRGAGSPGARCCGGSGVAPDNSSLLGSSLALPLLSCLKYSFTSSQTSSRRVLSFPPCLS